MINKLKIIIIIFFLENHIKGLEKYKKCNNVYIDIKIELKINKNNFNYY